uniref:HNH_5 domain-containing protein n=1 Tax=Heterorhabditis bacteriophora TaxID=37862 RepID=A0A1I7X1N2_HETBA
MPECIVEIINEILAQVRCTNCGEAPDHWQYIVLNEKAEVPGSRGEVNLIEKCKLCSRLNTIGNSINYTYCGIATNYCYLQLLWTTQYDLTMLKIVDGNP